MRPVQMFFAGKVLTFPDLISQRSPEGALSTPESGQGEVIKVKPEFWLQSWKNKVRPQADRFDSSRRQQRPASAPRHQQGSNGGTMVALGLLAFAGFMLGKAMTQR